MKILLFILLSGFQLVSFTEIQAQRNPDIIPSKPIGNGPSRGPKLLGFAMMKTGIWIQVQCLRKEDLQVNVSHISSGFNPGDPAPSKPQAIIDFAFKNPNSSAARTICYRVNKIFFPYSQLPMVSLKSNVKVLNKFGMR